MSMAFRQNDPNDRFCDLNDTLWSIQMLGYLVYLPTETRDWDLQRILIVEDEPAQL